MAATSEYGAILDQKREEIDEEKGRTSSAAKLLAPKGMIDPRGVVLTERSGLVVIAEMEPLAKDGLSDDEAGAHARIFQGLINTLPNGFTLNWWMDRGIVDSTATVLPSAGNDVLLESLQASRAERIQEQREFRNRYFLAPEYHGRFAFGGADISMMESLKAFALLFKTKDPAKRDELKAEAAAIWPGSQSSITNVLINRMEEDADLLVRETNRLIRTFGSDLRPRLVNTAETDETKYGLFGKILGPTEAARALYGLADHHPRRRRTVSVKDRDWARLPDFLTQAHVNFTSLYGRRTPEGRVLKVGQFSVGGAPRKIYAVRLLPEKVKPGLFEFFQGFPHAVTVKFRWSVPSQEDMAKDLRRLENEIRGGTMFGRIRGEAQRSLDDVQDVQDRQSEDQKVGNLTILIALGGVDREEDNRTISATEDLEQACDKIEDWAAKNQVTLAEEVDYQDVAFLSMFPGAVRQERLERLICHSDVFAAVIPIHDSYQASKLEPQMEPRAPFLMTTSRNGRHELVNLVTGKIFMAAVFGQMGGGKSFFANGVALGYLMAHPDAQVDIIEAGGSMEVTAEGAGGSTIFMADPTKPSCVNPFDVEVGADGYGPDDTEGLLLFVEGLLGRDYQPGSREKIAAQQALRQLGREITADDTGVRSVNGFCRRLDGLGDDGKSLVADLSDFRSDTKEPGRYSWLFPAVKNKTEGRIVDYTFPVNAGNPRVEGLALFAILQQVRRRIGNTYTHPHLVIQDEGDRFLNVAGDPLQQATAAKLGAFYSKALTQWRKLGAGLLLLTQSPDHINRWSAPLQEDLRKNLGTWVLFPLSDDGISGLTSLVSNPSAIRDAAEREQASRKVAPIQHAVAGLDKEAKEFLLVQEGRAQFRRLDEGWFGRAMFESQPDANQVKRWLQQNLSGTQLRKIEVFEKLLRDVSAKRLTWPEAFSMVKEGRV